MAVTYSNAVKVARMAAVVSQAGATAVLEIGTAGMATILATIPLGNPIAGAATGAGILTLSGFPRSDTAAAASGTAAAARIRTAPGGADIITGLTVTLTEGGGDIKLDSLSITAGQTVTITSAAFTHAA